MIVGMENERINPRLPPTAIIWLAIVVMLIGGPFIAVISEFVGQPFLGFWFAWLLTLTTGPLAMIRWINRRDDPRFKKRPPDAP
jgi:hypothetical protein